MQKKALFTKWQSFKCIVEIKSPVTLLKPFGCVLELVPAEYSAFRGHGLKPSRDAKTALPGSSPRAVPT
ncbi:hypothetical protein, partial [Aquibacillus kalidii]|uniref:hypothetical protein n=1 Tax=Aquibacillus kalidii TaxID=2762597 RepID=UPI001C99405B